MAKERIAETLAYMDQAIQAGQLHLDAKQFARFKAWAKSDNPPQQLLSLGWSRFHFGGRPDATARKAIRAYLLARICAGQVRTHRALHAEAERVKSVPVAMLHDMIMYELKEPILRSDETKALELTCAAHGGGQVRARATYRLTPRTLEEELVWRCNNMQEGFPAVLLIDMTGGNSGCNQQFGGRSVAQHQEEILRIAAENLLKVFDCVIGNAVTHQNLRDAYAGAQVTPSRRPMSGSVLRKQANEAVPFIISQLGNERQTVFVMGFHGNFCIHSTIFGSPGANYIEGLLDYGKTVITSRSVLATEMAGLAQEFGPIAYL